VTVLLEQLRGRISDVDSHEMMAASHWAEYYGAIGEILKVAVEPMYKMLANSKSDIYVEVESDSQEITRDSVWNERGPAAPSAMDLRRRPEVMDAMGIQRELIFPGFGFVALQVARNAVTGLVDEALIEAGVAGLRAHNDWAIELTRSYPDRLRPVGVVMTDGTVDDMVRDVDRLLTAGVRAFWIPTGEPPAGVSPADPILDPFYARIAEADATLTIHVGTGRSYPKSRAWGVAPQFSPDYSSFDALETPFDPYTITTLHLPEENFTALLVLGGVFERHPTLRFGAIELGASWIGPLAERMDYWVDSFSRWNGGLTMRPSEYVARNVRVAPFWQEPVDVWIQRYPYLQDVYCYASDYPHVEGGRQSLHRFYEKIAPLGDAVIEKFFCTNGQWLLPT
jgi:predicted TIM-barrel fold metal-dependent hydrolase